VRDYMNKKIIVEKYREGAGYHTFTWTKDLELEQMYKENEIALSEITKKQIHEFIQNLNKK